MSVLKYYKNTPRSPLQRATGPKCNFFSLNLQGSPWKKRGGCRPAPPRVNNGPSPRARQGACRPPPSGDRGKPPYIRSNPPLPYSFEPENSTKNPKKREE